MHVFWILTTIIFLVLLIIVTLFLYRAEGYEVDRFLYYTGHADHFLPSLHSLEGLCRAHAQEFPREYLEKYYALDFAACERLYHDRKTLPFPASYVENLYDAWSRLDEKYKSPRRIIVWYPRDRVERFDFPVLVKSRVMTQTGRGSILLKLNTVRHYERMHAVVKRRPQEAPFREKIARLVWRGAPTGYGFQNNIPFRTVSRETLLKKYHDSTSPHLDVGLVVKKPVHVERWKKYQKEEMSLETLLQYRYLLSVEGNDVATNLKWALASNSLVVMPAPQISSWFMEDALRPYVHYLPVRDDFSDLEEQVLWAEKNIKKCEKMIRNAHRYVEPFLDEKKEQRMQKSILQYYLDHFTWI